MVDEVYCEVLKIRDIAISYFFCCIVHAGIFFIFMI